MSSQWTVKCRGIQEQRQQDQYLTELKSEIFGWNGNHDSKTYHRNHAGEVGRIGREKLDRSLTRHNASQRDEEALESCTRHTGTGTRLWRRSQKEGYCEREGGKTSIQGIS